MTRYVLRSAALVVLCGGLIAVADAQPPAARPPAQPPAAQPPVRGQPPVAGQPAEAPHALRAKEVLGAKVQITGDVGIGTVEDLVFDDNGNMEYAIVVKDDKLITVPWAAVKFNFEQKIATVAITQSQYQVIPTYTARTYPTFWAPTYRSEVYGWYGLTPGQLRRIDRRTR